MYTVAQFAKIIGVTSQTLRNWDKKGIFKPEFRNEKSGYRYYTEKQRKEYLGEKHQQVSVVGYARVSSRKQKEALERQVDNIKSYMYAKGYEFEMITDIGSGINYNKKGLNELIKKIINREVSKLVILYKDRLVRFGYELIENICKECDTEIIIIDNSQKSEQEEVVEDLIQIITVFSCKLQGKKAWRTKKMIEELSNDKKNNNKAVSE